MKYLSVCSGIEAASVAWQPLGWEPVAFSEIERLQGFPDEHTNITHRGKPASDGARYKALGNSWAINCARWIGERIATVDAITSETRSAE